ncbi:hypothetical protein LIER_02353 [Lithospermum erythrorhizon]|uniref:DUF538 family protein n=1 Tax=Lithospermum erythrorhizon TaxID=34254 RepID=A0AAV3NPJ5_LITER
MPLPLLLLLTTLSAAASTSGAASLSGAHSELHTYGFPSGLLPSNIKSHSINRTSGTFLVEFDATCRITLPPDNYVAWYSKRVTGKIVENKIGKIEGISVRAFYKWWGITGIKISGEDLVFEVGLVTAKYPKKNFGEVPQCEGGKHSSS